MHKIDDATASLTQPAVEPAGPVTNGYFRPENPALGEGATVITVDWLNSVQNEISNVIIGAGISLNKAAQNQLYLAIQALIEDQINTADPVIIQGVTQNGHGFLKGELLYFNGTNWARAKADALSTSWTVGMVFEVTSTNAFRLLLLGPINGLTGLTPGITYYLSTTVAGAMQTTRPSTTGQVLKPVLIAESATSGYFYNWLPLLYGEGGGDTGDYLLAPNNLSDLADTAIARTNLGLGSAALDDSASFATVANNLSDIVDAALARTNLGLGTASLNDTGDFIAASELANLVTTTDLSTATSALQTNIDGKQNADATLDTLSGATVTTYALSLLDDADATTSRTTMGLGTAATAAATDFIAATDYTDFAQAADLTTLSGTVSTLSTTVTDIQTNYATTTALNTGLATKQDLDATLTNFAGLTIAANKLPYGTGADTFGLADFSPFARTFLDDADAATVRTTLGLGTASLSATTDFLAAGAGANYLAKASNLSDLANTGTTRTNLGLAIGTDVQAHSTVLDATTASYTTALNTKLGGIATGADVTSTTNVLASLNGASLTAVTPATNDKMVVQDTSDTSNIKTVTVQSIVDLATASSGTTTDPVVRLAGGYLSSVPQLVVTNLSATYIKYDIIVSELVSVGAANANLSMFLSVDNGANWLDAFYYVGMAQRTVASDTVSLQGITTASSVSPMIPARNLTNIAGRSQSGTISIFSPMSASIRTTAIARTGGFSQDGAPTLQIVMYQRNADEANNAFRIYMVNPSTGLEVNFSMRYAIYGYLA